MGKKKDRPPYPLGVPDDKPLVEMTRKEFTETFDRLGMADDWGLLEEARRGENQKVMLVAAILECPRQDDPAVKEPRLVIPGLEFGDKEGIRFVDDFIGSVRRIGMLLPGETIRRVVFRGVTINDFLENYGEDEQMRHVRVPRIRGVKEEI